jgi:hypothetical protein
MLKREEIQVKVIFNNVPEHANSITTRVGEFLELFDFVKSRSRVILTIHDEIWVRSDSLTLGYRRSFVQGSFRSGYDRARWVGLSWRMDACLFGLGLE